MDYADEPFVEAAVSRDRAMSRPTAAPTGFKLESAWAKGETTFAHCKFSVPSVISVAGIMV
jgi:hypothetical protein